jgi:hypothetical protein
LLAYFAAGGAKKDGPGDFDARTVGIKLLRAAKAAALIAGIAPAKAAYSSPHLQS